MKTEANKEYYYPNDDFKQYFVPYDLGYTKSRIGPKYDGGYIIYEELLKPINHIFSFGIGPEWDKEFELESMGKTIHMYDLVQFDISKLAGKNMEFKLAEINSSYLDSELDKIDEDVAVFMDIEGSEIETLNNLSDKNLQKISQISLEIHYIRNDNIELKNMMERLLENFNMFHIHGNNHGGICEIPVAMEATLLRKGLEKYKILDNTKYPIEGLDYPSKGIINGHEYTEDYVLDWWVK